MLHSVGFRAIALSHPEVELLRMDQDFRVRIDRLTRRVHEAVGVIGVHVGKDDVSDVGGIDSGRLQVGGQLAERGLHRVAGAGIDEHRRTVTLEQEVVHRNEKRAIICSADQLLEVARSMPSTKSSEVFRLPSVKPFTSRSPQRNTRVIATK